MAVILKGVCSHCSKFVPAQCDGVVYAYDGRFKLADPVRLVHVCKGRNDFTDTPEGKKVWVQRGHGDGSWYLVNPV